MFLLYFSNLNTKLLLLCDSMFFFDMNTSEARTVGEFCLSIKGSDPEQAVTTSDRRTGLKSAAVWRVKNEFISEQHAQRMTLN